MIGTKGLVALGLVLASAAAAAQVDEDELGAWYMYVWSAPFENGRLGLQGDIQHRNWDRGGDLEQLLIRGGLAWRPENRRGTYTFGAAHIVTGAYGASGAKSREDRLYQEALLPRLIGRRVHLTHRIRFEQRWVDGQDFRTRLRYLFGLNYPLNRDTLGACVWYLAFYNELFANLERDIGDGRRVEVLDRNRLYLAAGYGVSDGLRLQLGYMHQQTETVGKGQLQLSFVQAF